MVPRGAVTRFYDAPLDREDEAPVMVNYVDPVSRWWWWWWLMMCVFVAVGTAFLVMLLNGY